MSKLKLPDRSGQAMVDELDRTGVISKEFKDRLMVWILGLTREAYERGLKAAEREKQERDIDTPS